MLFVKVVVNLSIEKLDKYFEYIVPNELENKIFVGIRVVVPFGNRIIEAYVIDINTQNEYELEKLREVIKIVDNQVPLDDRNLQLAYYIRNTFGGTLNESIKVVAPVKDVVKKIQKYYISLYDNVNYLEYLTIFSKKTSKCKIIKYLLNYNAEKIEIGELVKELKTTKKTINSLVDEKILKLEIENVDRNLYKFKPLDNMDINLNNYQQKIYDRIISDYVMNKFGTYLLHGITGSGKTRIYINIINHMLSIGKDVILLIPEISLTYQNIHIFQSYFGEIVTVINSRMSSGEKYDQFLRCKKGEKRIVIGPRSALFAPLQNIGFIIIDEEHETSYKSNRTPKYDARDVAIEISKMENASVLLASATPSIVSYKKALDNEYVLLELKVRANMKSLPKIHLVDLRQELKNSNYSIFSNLLHNKIIDRLEKKEQIMLFINRRGYIGTIVCRSCGESIKCNNCDISMTYHNNINKLICHYCSYEIEYNAICPKCKSTKIKPLSIGTEKVEEYTKLLFPKAKVLRMDADTTRGKNSYDKILEAFKRKEADILIGTQMIVKGHDYPDVTLVGILSADLSLRTNDYNSCEQTFNLLVQASGRAGRADKYGEVILQTYNPEHYAVVAAVNQDYDYYYKNEILYRKLNKIPPFTNLLAIYLEDKDEKNGFLIMKSIRESVINKFNDILILGPNLCTITKINNIYRFVLYIKDDDYTKLIKIKDLVEKDFKFKIQVEFNPVYAY